MTAEHVVAHQVGPRVAHVHQAQPGAGEEDRGERGSHALELGLVLDQLGDGVVARVGGVLELAQQVAAGLVVVERGQRGDDHLGGDLARGVPAHAVGEREQPGPGVDRVLVVGPDQAAVAAGRVAQDERTCNFRLKLQISVLGR